MSPQEWTDLIKILGLPTVASVFIAYMGARGYWWFGRSVVAILEVKDQRIADLQARIADLKSQNDKLLTLQDTEAQANSTLISLAERQKDDMVKLERTINELRKDTRRT